MDGFNKTIFVVIIHIFHILIHLHERPPNTLWKFICDYPTLTNLDHKDNK